MSQSSSGQSFADRIRPWECAVCGQKNISANKGDCPHCHAPRAGSSGAQAEEVSGQTTRVYEGEKALTAGITAMAHQGWRVVSQNSFQPRAGAGRTVALGFVGAALWKPPVKHVITFERVTSTPTQP
jgi:hypothetical protein